MWTFRAGGLDAAGPEIADVNGDAIDEIIVGSDGGSLFCLNDTESPLTWRTNLGEPISAVASGGLRGNAIDILAGSAVGGVTVVAGDGTPLASANVGAPVNCVAASVFSAGEPARALVGTADGAVVVFALE
jgi:outer membrane protein assembly factor BamB